jgi:hypothetical protein
MYIYIYIYIYMYMLYRCRKCERPKRRRLCRATSKRAQAACDQGQKARRRHQGNWDKGIHTHTHTHKHTHTHTHTVDTHTHTHRRPDPELAANIVESTPYIGSTFIALHYMYPPPHMYIVESTPYIGSTFTIGSVKRDLLQCQKRPIERHPCSLYREYFHQVLSLTSFSSTN